ncbi:MAG: hypothetical protein ACOX3T_05575 [Bdellovibrionota bacterium]
MKKYVIIFLIVLTVAGIIFVPAILNVSTTIKLKKDVDVVIDKTKKIGTKVKEAKDLQNFVKIKEDKKIKQNKFFKKQDKAKDKDSKDSQDSKNDSDGQVDVENRETQVTFLSLNPLEEIEWLIHNIYIQDLDESREQVINKDITQIEWEHIKSTSASQTLKNILLAIDKLLTEIPNSEVLSPVESAKLRNLIIKYSSSINFLLKPGTRNVSAKESLGIVINSYNALMQYINNLQVSVQIKGKNFDFEIGDIKFEKFFECQNIKHVLSLEDNFIADSDIYLKWVQIKDVDGEKTLNFNVEISGKGIKRLELFNQYGLYESVDVNFPLDKSQTRVFYFNKSYTAKGIYVIKIINEEGKSYYKRYLFYPRVTLFQLEHGEYKLPFLPENYKKLDGFFEIKILRTRMNSKFFDREFIASF